MHCREASNVEPRVYVIVLNWNGFSDTSACLSSLQQLRYSNYRVIVVDNGSTDDSASRIIEQFPGMEVIETGKNLGFAGGCNVGIRRALADAADSVWLLNSDTTVDRGALRALVDKIGENARVGAVGSAIYFMDRPQRMQVWGGGYVNFWLGRSGHFLEPVPDRQIPFLTGASLLISRRAIEAVGMLDEDFFMYWEDADFCFRLRRAGWQLAVAGKSRVWHKGYTSIGKGSVSSYQYFNASAYRFFKKHAAVPLFSFWVGFGLRLAKRIVVGDWEKTRAVWAGRSQRGMHRSSSINL
jgi:GT2 family glycosyltransferase